jgi:oligopeptidase B
MISIAQTVPPIAAKYPQTFENHGDKRVDEYYWMNDFWRKGSRSDEVVSYLEKENAYAAEMMKHTEGMQQSLYDEMLKRIKQTDESVPYFHNGYWYITKTEQGKEYAKYVRKKGTMTAEEQLLLDGNEMGKNHKYFALSTIAVSPDNKILAYSIDTVSRRKYGIFFKNLETGEMYPDVIANTAGSIVWANDNKTVFYVLKNDVTLRSEKIVKHILGTDPKNDIVVFHEKDETFNTNVSKTKSEEYILIGSGSTISSEIRFIRADQPSSAFTMFLERKPDLLYRIDHYKNDFYIITNWNARNFRLMKTPVNKTEQAAWIEVIPHREDVLLQSMQLFNNYLVLNERKNGLNYLRVKGWDDNKEHYLDFGEPVYVSGFGANPEFNTDVLRFTYQSMKTPFSTFDYNMKTKEKKLMKQTEVLGGYDPSAYQTERLWATAKDGTKIPISIVYKKNFKRDGTQPLLLYGYGSYGSSTDPTFSTTRLSLLERGFAFAIAHIRGGQEMGRYWYEDGKMFKKKNTFTDFIDAAEFLIKNKYTSPAHLYANGGSAGGLLMGAVVNMRPDLWKAVAADVPFVDVITTMLDESIPLTTGEFKEWGNPKDKDSYTYMKSYSPYDNVEKKAYPHLLVTTGLHDSQVQYFEPAKWVARLRANKTDNNKLLFFTNMEAGHGGASGRFQALKQTARMYAFFLDLEGLNKKGF